ncbi:hypothetical protein I302_108508 [Kwoniella bestiolae CBS 10118]|uniref:Uncharacterized protein n=1 Tax=Kwoniella bestiolae CBS 10118 TaxID=1296100 RepID=A0AAJ8MD13_9TREE
MLRDRIHPPSSSHTLPLPPIPIASSSRSHNTTNQHYSPPPLFRRRSSPERDHLHLIPSEIENRQGIGVGKAYSSGTRER